MPGKFHKLPTSFPNLFTPAIAAHCPAVGEPLDAPERGEHPSREKRPGAMVSRMKQHDFVVVANRLPVNAHTDEDGSTTFERAPGGLVTALAPMMSSEGGAGVGGEGTPDEELAPFSDDGLDVVPVLLAAEEVQTHCEGFSNAALWPLYHDVLVDPEYHREWWPPYREVNERFAEAAARA